MSTMSKALGARLRQYRIQKGYSQERLAGLAGVHPTYVGQLERGEKNPHRGELGQARRRFGHHHSPGCWKSWTAPRPPPAIPCGPTSSFPASPPPSKSGFWPFWRALWITPSTRG